MIRHLLVHSIYSFTSICLIIFVCCLISGCSPDEEDQRFTLLSSSQTQINFKNTIVSSEKLNIQNYGYFYDGGGVAVGDINNDGLPDIYFIGNERQNRLYLNKGNFVFEDVTEFAGVGGGTEGWSTGATMADVNGDGFLDIYVSRVNYANKTGTNQLFINNRNRTFTEQASEYGLDFNGYSKQAVFFDYNNNGRLDLFLLNHSFHSEKTRGRAESLRTIKDSKAGDRLFKNDGDKFTDVTEDAGIYSSALGYGLGVAVSDINNDGWPDVYVGNDYHEDDYLYINNGDATFSEALYSSVQHTSKSSMGNDIGDLNNDGYVEIFSLDMLPEDNDVLRRSGVIDSYERMQNSLRFGFKHQFAQNTLQLNRGSTPEGTPLFSDIGFLSGVAATDWSWATLILDMDNDGFKDIYVTNGMVGRPTDIDYNRLLQNRQISLNNDIDKQNLTLIDEMPSAKISNYAFRNNGNLTFSNKAKKWGLDQPGFSSGAAYADLNNDGSLDIVVNNVNMPAFIYRNNTVTSGITGANYLKVQLVGQKMNTSGIGSKILLYQGGQVFFQEQMPTRGFQSSVAHTLHFGLGNHNLIDSLTVIWPDRSTQTIENVKVNRVLELRQQEASGIFNYKLLRRSYNDALFVDAPGQIDFEHRENDYNDFMREPFLPYKMSSSGPAITHGDINGNGRDDLFIGGAQGQAGKLFFQQDDGSFSESPSIIKLFEVDKESEDVSATFFDANGDSLPDLYVVSGGNEIFGRDEALKDRLYLNEGEGEFRKATGSLPDFYENGSVVTAADFNQDGKTDLFVGSRRSLTYGVTPKSYLLENDGTGKFRDVTDTVSPELREVGMVTDAEWARFSDSDYPDLVLVGEWMPVSVFRNDGVKLVPANEEIGLTETNGLWSELLIDDFNGDGNPDIVVGNFGKNSRLKASEENPLRLYIHDFEDNGHVKSVIAHYRDDNYYPFDPLSELTRQFRSFQNKITTYAEYSTKTMQEIFGGRVINEARSKEIKTLSSLYLEYQEDNTFTVSELPKLAQIAPVMGMHSGDFNGDGNKDLILGGNIHDVRPSIGGRQDASYGLMLKGNGRGNFKSVDMHTSGIYVNGEARKITALKTSSGDTLIVIAKSNQRPQTLIRN